MTFSLTITTAAETDAQEQQSRSEAVTVERDRRLAAGAVVAVTGYGDIPVQGRIHDQINLIALGDTARDLIEASISGAIIPFRDGDNVMHILTPQQVAELTRKGKAAASAIYAAAWAIKDIAEIPADFADDANWPA